ncbi:MAG: LysM peptidoglycan-binding domain-containing protein [Dehalococcoidia bacterium]
MLAKRTVVAGAVAALVVGAFSAANAASAASDLTAGPAGTSTVSQQASSETYAVQAGDTLYSIAQRFGSTVDAVASANGISDPNLIYPGQMLTIPSGSGGGNGGNGGQSATYTVQAGDTLYSIAQRFGSTVNAIASASGVADANVIYPGQVLTIPAQGGGGGDDGGDSSTVTYVVQSGDTLNAIAMQFGSTVSQIADASGVEDVNVIYPGQVLTIPTS